jgi:DNA-binding CsgD family transcriptional regulator
MINNNEITEIKPAKQIAGLLPNDINIEFFGIRESKKVLYLQAGCTHYFNDLPMIYYNLIKSRYLKDHNAVAYISKIHEELKDQVELYTYYIYGDLNILPDIKNGVLSASENFRDQKNCPSLAWNKTMNIGSYILTNRDLQMIDMMAADYIDTAIAAEINVSNSHCDALKRNLFKNTNTHSKTALVLKAKSYKVI